MFGCFSVFFRYFCYYFLKDFCKFRKLIFACFQNKNFWVIFCLKNVRCQDNSKMIKKSLRRFEENSKKKPDKLNFCKFFKPIIYIAFFLLQNVQNVSNAKIKFKIRRKTREAYGAKF